MVEALDTVPKGRLVKVQIHAPTYALTHTCSGYIYCLEGRRLLDQLNDVFPSAMPEGKDFLSVSEVEMSSLAGKKRMVRFACLNKANILFVREYEDYQSRGIGGKPGPKSYPYVSKSPVAVKLYLPFYILTGQMHCIGGERVSDALNMALRFLPLTNVTIYPSAPVGSEPGVGFVAVNKGQVILLEELESLTVETPDLSEASDQPSENC